MQSFTRFTQTVKATLANFNEYIQNDDFTPTPLCHTCSDVFGARQEFIGEGTEFWTESDVAHAESLEAVQQSATSGCSICSWIYAFCEHRNKLDATGAVSFNVRVENRGLGTTYSLGLNVGGKEQLAWFSLLPYSATRNQLHIPGLSITNVISDTNDSDSSRAVAQQWLNLCRTTHTRCRKAGRGGYTIPSRLLECEVPWQATARVRLKVKDGLDGNVEYVALSHCWGKSPIYTLRTETESRLREGVSLQELSATFRDAFEVCSWFGYRYLWIDSLCILQDSPEDWARESYLMSELYTNASLTIAAAAARDSSEGLFRERNPTSIEVPKIHLGWQSSIKGQYCFWDGWLWGDYIERSTLSGRAWAIQERMLSSRVLFFARKQMYFECNSTRCCESLPNGPPPVYVGEHPMKLMYPRVDPMKAWHSAVDAYTPAALTKSTDKYIAIAGIARKMQEATGDEYVAGLWRRGLTYQLLWSTQATGTHGPHQCRPPTWSWLKINEKISPIFGRGEGELLVTNTAARVDLEDSTQPMGTIKSATLYTRGKVKKVKWNIKHEYGTGDFRRYQITLSNLTANLRNPDDRTSHMFCRPDFLPTESMLQSDIFALPIKAESRRSESPGGEVQGLLLMRSRKKRDQYVRVGWFACSYEVAAKMLSQRFNRGPMPDDSDSTARQLRNDEKRQVLRSTFQRWVSSRRAPPMILDMESGEAPCPAAFTVEEDEETAVAKEKQVEAEEAWRVCDLFYRLYNVTPYEPDEEDVPSRDVEII